jgi:hypothetical protein
VSQIGVNLYKTAKNELDPKNIFGLNNLLAAEDQNAEQQNQLQSKL